MKYGYDLAPFKNYKFIDSVKVFQSLGYKRPGLDTLGTPRRQHSAIQDVQLLRDISRKLSK